MKQLAYAMLALLFITQACTPKVKTQIVKQYAPLGKNEEVIVFERGQFYPEDAEEVGTIKISDSGFTTECTYEMVLENARVQARKAGGNAVAITEHSLPDFGSSCHRIKAKILRMNDPKAFLQAVTNTIEDKDIALLHVYRPGGMGTLVGYNLFLGDSLICRVKNNWKETLVIKKSSSTTIWAKTETKAEIPIRIDLGHEYFIRCGLDMGAFVGRPTLYLVNAESGRLEFDSVKGK
jgi:hypothetical protein